MHVARPTIANYKQNMNTSVATLPSTSTSIISPKGNVLGNRYFIGSKSAKEIKEVGRSLGLKGNALSKYVNEALTSESANRAVTTAAGVAALTAMGFVGDRFDVKEKAAALHFVKPGVSKAVKESAKDKRIKELEAKLAAIEAKLAKA